ncbi:MAG: STAS domain-containing protein [Candidatus Omnitrophica bacterium]|nr:STAS domain-containing protein [Candidatus Omnitrophota bacterium]
MPLKVTLTKKEEGVFTVAPVGSIDTETYTILEEQLKPILVKTTKAIMFDMQGVTYISSMGLSVIFKTKMALAEYEGTLAIINLQPQIKKVFEAVQVLPDNYFSTMEAAEKYLDEFLTDLQQKEIDKDQPS